MSNFSQRKNNDNSLKSILKTYFETIRADKKLYNAQLQNNWESIVGKTISNRTSNMYIKNNTLYITVHSAPLKQELLYLKKALIEKINTSLESEEIKDIVFY